MRLIDADALTKLHCEGCAEDVRAICKDDPVCARLMWIAEAPTIEAEPVRHGRWDHIGGDEWCCTNCGEVISTEGSWDKPTYKHCHECGAKMQE